MQTPANPQAAEQHNDSIATPDTTYGRRLLHRCDALMRGGQRCTRDVATIFLDGRWLCPSHRPRLPKATDPKPPKLPKPPVTALREPADAQALSSWAAVQTALGRLDHQRSNAVSAACREFRQSWALTRDVRFGTDLVETTLAYWEAETEADKAAAFAKIGQLIAQHRSTRTAEPEAAPTPRRGPAALPDEFDGISYDRLPDEDE